MFGFKLDPEDRDQIDAVLGARGPYQVIGNCGDEYRR